MPIRLRRLTPDDLALVAVVEAATFPIEQRRGFEQHRAIMGAAHVQGKNFSAGAFDGSRLVGYVLMYTRQSDFFAGQEVGYLMSLAVLPEYRRSALIPLLRWIGSEALICGYSFEANCHESPAFRLVERHWSRFEQWGGRLTPKMRRDESGSQQMIAIRYDPLRMSGSSFIQGFYWGLTRTERLRRMLRILPRRILRKSCATLPRWMVPHSILRAAYLEQLSK